MAGFFGASLLMLTSSATLLWLSLRFRTETLAIVIPLGIIGIAFLLRPVAGEVNPGEGGGEGDWSREGHEIGRNVSSRRKWPFLQYGQGSPSSSQVSLSRSASHPVQAV